MIAGAYGGAITQHDAALLANTNEQTGTSTEGLVAALVSRGLRVDAAESRSINDVREALGREHIAVVCYTEPVLEWGHYAIVESVQDDTVTLIDPDARTGKTSLKLDEFERRWKDPLFTKTVRWAAFVSATE